METEIATLRTELRDCKQRGGDLNSRITELQRLLSDAQSDRKRSDDRVSDLEKVGFTWSCNPWGYCYSRSTV